jgi:Lrp/AsnC family transcriptional regulator for asnA, asnC and gidA
MFEYINFMVRISNLELLKLLKENSRVPYTELARRFGVSETAVRKKMRKLEEDGVIRKYTVELDPKKMGYDANAIIGVDTTPERYMDVMEKLKVMKDVACMYSSSGDHMICIECWFRDSRKLREFLKNVEELEGVTRTCPAIIQEKIK